MNWLYKLERKYKRFGIPNLMIYITAAMLLVFVMQYILRMPIISLISFSRTLILRGQVWRLISFIFMPPSNSVLWVAISLYFYYFIGSTLEDAWSPFLFTAYYVFGVLGAIVAGFISGGVDNTYLNMSLFFAFAQLFPDQQVLLFFFIPIKIKYLAYLNWGFFALSFIMGTEISRISIVFSVINFFLFFGPDIFKTIKNNMRTSKRRRQFRKDMHQNRDMWGN